MRWLNGLMDSGGLALSEFGAQENCNMTHKQMMEVQGFNVLLEYPQVRGRARRRVRERVDSSFLHL